LLWPTDPETDRSANRVFFVLWPTDPKPDRSANRGGVVANAPQIGGCGSLPQNPLALPTPLAYQPHVPTPTTKESHMTDLLCAFTRGKSGGTWGMYRA